MNASRGGLGGLRLRGLSPAEKDAYPDAQCIVIRPDGEESTPVSRETAQRMIAEARG